MDIPDYEYCRMGVRLLTCTCIHNGSNSANLYLYSCFFLHNMCLQLQPGYVLLTSNFYTEFINTWSACPGKTWFYLVYNHVLIIQYGADVCLGAQNLSEFHIISTQNIDLCEKDKRFHKGAAIFASSAKMTESVQTPARICTTPTPNAPPRAYNVP